MRFLLWKSIGKILIFIRMIDEGVLSFRTIERNPFDCKFSESILYKGSPIHCFYTDYWIGEPDLMHSRWQANTNPLTPRIIASVRFAGLPSVARQYKPPCHCVPLLKRGRIKTSSERWGFIIECLSCEISHKHKRGVLYESRIMLNNEWCGFCCSGRFFWRISIIKSSHFFEIVVSEITRSSFCTSYSISWTSTKPESSNGIVTHDTSTDIELIDSFNFYNR